MSSRRLDHGGAIDRNVTFAFSFDGKPFAGHPGDTLASALLAAGVHTVGRSAKFHRPRGVWGAWVEEPNAIFDLVEGGRRRLNCKGNNDPARRRRRGVQRERAPDGSGRSPRLAGPFRPLHSGRVLLQDLHVARLALVRAAHPRHDRAGPSRPAAPTGGLRAATSCTVRSAGDRCRCRRTVVCACRFPAWAGRVARR